MAGKSSTRVLLVTANIASCFEQPDTMLKPWITEFLKTVEDHEPQFIALHCQEVGGKNYEESMQHVEHFVRLIRMTLIGKVQGTARMPAAEMRYTGYIGCQVNILHVDTSI
nr:type I inositol 1,4,5-trisphosphate 5-phosphatase-like isoform X2 [Penaeus vannamei]